MLTFIIDGTDVHDYVASVEDSRVPGTLHVCYTTSVEPQQLPWYEESNLNHGKPP